MRLKERDTSVIVMESETKVTAIENDRCVALVFLLLEIGCLLI